MFNARLAESYLLPNPRGRDAEQGVISAKGCFLALATTVPPILVMRAIS
jgi:hypothetical protein